MRAELSAYVLHSSHIGMDVCLSKVYCIIRSEACGVVPHCAPLALLSHVVITEMSAT